MVRRIKERTEQLERGKATKVLTAVKAIQNQYAQVAEVQA
jgi:hypothetical protein